MYVKSVNTVVMFSLFDDLHLLYVAGNNLFLG